MTADDGQADGERSVVLLGLIAAVVAFRLAWSLHEVDAVAQVHLPWMVIAAGFALTEIHVVHFEHRSEAHSVSFSAVPLVIGLFALSPIMLVAARLVGTGVALVGWRRQSPLKLGVNLASFCLADTFALLMFHGFLPDTFGIASWPVAYAVVLVADQIQGLVVTTAIGLYQGRFELLGGPAVLGPVSSVVNTSFALLAVILLQVEPLAVALLATAVPVLYVAYGFHARLVEQHRQLERLHDSTRQIHESVLEDRVVPTLLRQVAELLRANSAWLCVEQESGDLLRLGFDAAGSTSVGPAPVSSADLRLHRRARTRGGAFLVAADRCDRALASDLRGIGVCEVLVAPVTRLGAPPATLVVADRSGAVRGFDPDDLCLFETLVGHTTTTLQNGHLLDRLRQQAAESEHQSLHDSLTGLANRVLFGRRLTEALQARKKVAVLVVDLDRFKEVNDTLGHHSGDVLLVAVADRLRVAVRTGDLVARTGSDEFAVLVTDVGSVDSAVAVAQTIRGALDEPLEVAHVNVAVTATVGVAVSPLHGYDHDSLLSRADIALQTGKADRSGVAVFDPTRDDHTSDRLFRAAQVRNAIEECRVAVHFQPQVCLRTGEVLGAEALVRWAGDAGVEMGAAELVDIAEHIGMIRPLTRFVLRTAIVECRRLHEAGHRLRVSVNVSMHDLLDASFVDDVLGLLDVAGLPADALCLELTETSVMADPQRTIAVLERLCAAGVGVSVDDFGTGYSSLAYLTRLPVDELKIDRSFVAAMGSDGGGEPVVRAVLQLGRDLGLRVIAEGIEDEEVRSMLSAMGCTSGQGYLFSRAMPVDDFRAWVAARGPSISDVVIAN